MTSFPASKKMPSKSTAFTRVLFSVLLLCSSAWADHERHIELNLRYRNPSFRSKVLDQTVLYEASPNKWIDGRLGARISQSEWGPYCLAYMAEASYPSHYPLSVSARLTHNTNIADQLATTQWLFTARYQTPEHKFLQFFLEAGWMASHLNIDGGKVLPSFFGSTVNDNNWATSLGFVVQYKTIHAKLWGATFDGFEAFNLNEPFLQIDVEYQPQNSKYSYGIFSRYQLALGFGRLAEWAIGARIGINLHT